MKPVQIAFAFILGLGILFNPALDPHAQQPWSARFCLLTTETTTALTPAATAQGVPTTVAPAAHAAVTPVPREQEWWQQRHASFNERVKQGNADLIFIGDSITQGWEGAGAPVWQKFYDERNAVNLGIGGDRTQHVLWRLENGNLEGISPKVAVIMIGTNNSNGQDHTAPEIADGVRTIVRKLREERPNMKILLLGIFPRGEQVNNQRGKILQVNQIIQKLDDGEMIHYLDIGHRFVEDDGSISNDIMPDHLHLSEKGYTIWAEAIEAMVAELLGE